MSNIVSPLSNITNDILATLGEVHHDELNIMVYHIYNNYRYYLMRIEDTGFVMPNEDFKIWLFMVTIELAHIYHGDYNVMVYNLMEDIEKYCSKYNLIKEYNMIVNNLYDVVHDILTIVFDQAQLQILPGVVLQWKITNKELSYWLVVQEAVLEVRDDSNSKG